MDDAEVRASADFADFYESNRTSLVRALAVTTGDAELAADSVDEAMTRAWDRWDRVQGLESPAGWVYHVALNHGRSRWRRQRRLWSTGEPPPTGAPDRNDDAPLDDDLQRAVLALPVEQREVVVLRLLLDLDTAATAASLGIPEGTVRSRLARAVARLRSTMEVRS